MNILQAVIVLLLVYRLLRVEREPVLSRARPRCSSR
jgi:hypothetical protein